MNRVYCPQCGGTRVINGKSPLLVILGLLVLVSGLFCLITSFPGPWLGNWSRFVTLEHEDHAAVIAIIFGLLLLWGGTRHWRDAICTQCGYTWELRRRIEWPTPHHSNHSH